MSDEKPSDVSASGSDDRSPEGTADRQWFERLAGRLTEVDDMQALREADELRAAVLREHAWDQASDAAERDLRADEVKRERLLFAARQAGLLGRRRMAWSKWAAAGSVAAALVAGVTITQQLRDRDATGGYGEPPELRMRGAVPVVITDATPRMRAEALSAALVAAGASVTIYQKAGEFTLDVQVEPEHAAAISQAAAKQSIELSSGYTRVRVRKP